MNDQSTAELVDESAQDSLLEERRQKVQTLRLRRLTPLAIASAINESLATVEADLEWFRQEHAARYGAMPTIDPAQEIGWAVADFEEMESAAWKEFYALKSAVTRNSALVFAAQRPLQGWLRTAAMMRVLRVKLLAERALLQPAFSSKATAPGADEIRALLRAEGLLLSEGPLEMPVEIDDATHLANDRDHGHDPIVQWADDGGLVLD